MRKILFSALTIFMLSLTACGSAVSNGTQSASSTVSDSNTGSSLSDSTIKPNSLTLSVSYNNALPITIQLIIGIYKLDSTDKAITLEQAADLLPLWQVYQSLSQSDNVAQAEVDALIKQIQETMTSEQITAIKDMKLTPVEMSAILQEKGIVSGTGKGSSSSSTTSSRPSGGGSPGGGDPGGQAFGPEQMAPVQAAQTPTNGSGSNIVPSSLIDGFIQFLQQKVTS